MLKVGAYLPTVSTMAIAHCEEVAMTEAHNMRVCNVRILIDFVRVMS
jgi:hypothetical protein